MKVLIIGASSGIGKALAEYYTPIAGTIVAGGRRLDRLTDLANTSPGKIVPSRIDIRDCAATTTALERIFAEHGPFDVAIVCAGTGELNPDLAFDIEEPTLRTNVIGWTCCMDTLWRLFAAQGYGHIAAVSSAGGFRGEPMAPAYSASKAYQMNYLEAMRKKAAKTRLPLFITDIRPGLTDTAMAKGEGLFWVMPPDKVARQIAKAIKHRCGAKAVTKRWRLLSSVIRHLPDWLYDRI